MGFFLAILGLDHPLDGLQHPGDEVHALHWKSFDPFPAFVAYLLISNVIQILLMPLIMVGQNVQGRHTEIRAQLDFEINQKAEKEVMVGPAAPGAQHGTADPADAPPGVPGLRGGDAGHHRRDAVSRQPGAISQSAGSGS